MGPSIGSDSWGLPSGADAGFPAGARGPVRLLALGNEILADDAFGFRVADEAERRFPGQFEIVRSSSAGFDLLDSLVDASRLLIVDTILTGSASPGAIRVFRADRIRPAPGGSPHFLGLFEVLAVAKRLGLPVPESAIVVAVEASDCTTVGGGMHPDVQSAIPEVLEMVGRILADG
jgi:hydrogenase maturation protease